VRSGKEDEEESIYQKLKPIVEAMPGFISMKSYVADDGRSSASSVSTRGNLWMSG